MAKRTINIGGRDAQAELVKFKTIDEPWCEYECEDGTRIRMKLVVSEVLRVEGAYTPEGEPLYLIKSNNIASTEAPEELRQKKGGSGGGGALPGTSGQYV